MRTDRAIPAPGVAKPARDSAARIFKAGAAILIAAAICFAAPSSKAQSTQESAGAIRHAESVLWSNPNAEDLSQARQALEKAALQGDVEAQRILGIHLLLGQVLERDVEQGLRLLETAASTGKPAAEAELGEVYLWGQLVPANRERAMLLLGSAADKGNPTAQRVLGEQLVGGWILPRDAERGRALLERAIRSRDDKAQVALGKLLLYGQGLDADPSQALDYFEAAAEAGNGHGLAAYGEQLMWKFTAPSKAEAMLLRAGELGASEAWVALAHGAMYGYLGGGSVSRAKFDGYAEKARAAGEEDIAVLEATRNMWGISMRASGPETLARLQNAAAGGNAAAARFLIELLRDGNGLNVHRDLAAAAAALDRHGALFSDKERAQYELTLQAAKARTPQAYAPVVDAIRSRPDLKSAWFGQEIVKANLNVAFYILQQKFRENGSYSGPLDGYATRSTLRALYKACRGLDHPERCDDNIMRPDVIADILAQ